MGVGVMSTFCPFAPFAIITSVTVGCLSVDGDGKGESQVAFYESFYKREQKNSTVSDSLKEKLIKFNCRTCVLIMRKCTLEWV